PNGRIDLVGITLEIFGPNPTAGHRISGIETLRRTAAALGTGDSSSGTNVVVDATTGATTMDGKKVPEGWLVFPHDSPIGGLTQADVQKIVTNAIIQANKTRAAIRLPAGVKTKMVIAVADKAGNVLGLYRMPDSTIFSIDVAVAKARNTA